MVIKLEDKVALITGSSAGIGAATAVLFSSLGAKVVLVGRNQEKLDQVSREVSAKSPKNYKPLIVNADLSKEEDVKKVFDETIATYSRLDILVNNAGVLNRKLFNDDSYLEDYDRVFQVNVRSVVQLCHLAAPYLAQVKGSIVNVSAIGSGRPYSSMWCYCMTKSAMDMMTKTLAQDLAPNVRVNSVNPGPIKTDIINHLPNPDELFRDMGALVPLGAVGEAEDIANVIAFLASDAAKNMTGSIVVSDGGSLILDVHSTIAITEK